MRIKLNVKCDHLSAHSEYDVIEPKSPLYVKSSSGNISSLFNTHYLVIVLDGEHGHTYDSTVRAWWIPQSCADILERDTDVCKVRVGQRWLWNDSDAKEVVEITALDAGNRSTPGQPTPQIHTRIVHVISGDKRIGETNRWSFNSNIWFYLPGQDAPQR